MKEGLEQLGRQQLLELLSGKAKYLKVWESTASGRNGEYTVQKVALFETDEELRSHEEKGKTFLLQPHEGKEEKVSSYDNLDDGPWAAV